MSKSKTKVRNVDTQASLGQLHAPLTQIARCLGFMVLHANDLEKKPNSDLIPFLKRLGFGASDIAVMLNTTVNTVNKELSIAKSGKKDKNVRGRKVKSDDTDQPAIVP